MIIKEKTFVPTQNPALKAGDAAEKQMAFYFNRQFAEVQGVHVFNDLRLVRSGEVAQIDHLILHRHGTIIIESKSVSTIRMNEQHEFERKSGGKWTGMPSPIAQAKRQGDLFRALLVDHKRDLRDRKIFGLVQGGFKHMPVNVLVAISDQGLIKGKRQGTEEVMKADQIAPHAMTIIHRLKKAYKLTSKDSTDDAQYQFTSDEFERVTQFLLAQHTPSLRQETQSSLSAPPSLPPTSPQPTAPTRPLPAYLCTHCQSTNLTIRFGHSYYFKCQGCDGNTPIKNICPDCGNKTTTAKQGTTYSTTCKPCETSTVFFINPT